MPSRLFAECARAVFAAVRRFTAYRSTSAVAVAAVALLCAGTAWAASNIIEYTRDAAGNITALARPSASSLAITSFSPASGSVGTVVTIYGSGFSATPSGNAVAFNGTSAAVSASSINSITTSVPSGASTGKISVTVAGTTVSSSADFVVNPANAPTITAFTPASGDAGVSVNVTGTNFDPNAGATTVKLNGVSAGPSVSSTTALSFPVPAGAGSGRITATTSLGTATSADDFIVPPTGVSAADILKKVRIAVDGEITNVSMGTANKHAMLLFDVDTSGYYSIQLSAFETSPTTGTINYKVIAPDNSVLQTGTVGNVSKPSIHLPKLTATGTYSVLLSPGLATLNINARVITNATLTVDGTAGLTAFDWPNQSWRFVFDATAGQRIGVGAANLTFVPATATPPLYIKVYNPDGTLLSSATTQCNGPQVGNTQGNCDGEFAAAVTGTHTIVVESPANGYGNLSLYLNNEVVATLVADTAQAVTLGHVGQDGRFSFTAAAGDSVGIDLSDVSLSPAAQAISAVVTKPGGSQVSCSFASPGAGYCNLGTLSAAGTYTVTLDPAFGAFGTMKLTLKQGALISGADAPSAFAPTGVSETARFRFIATAGQNLAIGVSGVAYAGSGGNSSLKVYRPDGSSLASANCSPVNFGATCHLTLTNLAAGTYAATVEPPQGVKVSGNLSVSNDLTGTLTANVTQALNAARPGQVARFTFAGTAGDSTAVKIYGLSTVPANQSVQLIVYSPAGTGIAASGTVPVRGIANLPSLPSTGSYTAVVEPLWGVTWQGTLVLDPGASITVDGSAATMAAGVGEPIRYRVTGTAGQRLEFGLSGLSYDSANGNSTSFALYRSDGSTVMSASCVTAAACETFSASLPATGTYSVVLLPPVANAVTGGSVVFSTPVTGTLSIAGGSQTIAITRTGQTARYTFSGTSGQLLRLNWSGVTVAGTATVNVSVLKPDGSTLSTGSFANGASGGFDVASLPTTGTYTIVFDPATGATMSAPVTLVTR